MGVTKAIPIFVISLPGSSRLDPLKKRLVEFDIPFEKIEAIDGRGIDEKELSRLYDEDRALKKIDRPMSRGEIGNALSHRKVWRIIIDRNLAAALVLEEDAVIDKAFCSFLLTVPEIPKHIGFVSLYTASGGLVYRRASASLGEFKLHRAAVGLAGTVAYVINAKYARMLLDRKSRVETPTDWPAGGFVEREQHLAFPMPVSHHYDESVIESERATTVQKRRKPLKTIWPSWIPAWLRAAAYMTCVVYLLRPDRYDGFVDYFRRQIALRVRLAVCDTVTVARLKCDSRENIKEP
jgi:glycosyl transferase family 25